MIIITINSQNLLQMHQSILPDTSLNFPLLPSGSRSTLAISLSTWMRKMGRSGWAALLLSTRWPKAQSSLDLGVEISSKEEKQMTSCLQPKQGGCGMRLRRETIWSSWRSSAVLQSIWMVHPSSTRHLSFVSLSLSIKVPRSLEHNKMKWLRIIK